MSKAKKKVTVYRQKTEAEIYKIVNDLCEEFAAIFEATNCDSLSAFLDNTVEIKVSIVTQTKNGKFLI